MTEKTTERKRFFSDIRYGKKKDGSRIREPSFVLFLKNEIIL